MKPAVVGGGDMMNKDTKDPTEKGLLRRRPVGNFGNGRVNETVKNGDEEPQGGERWQQEEE